MKIFLAGSYYGKFPQMLKNALYVLQTFYDAQKWSLDEQREIAKLPKEFLLDSGAFTFMNSGKKVDWQQYVNEYADYIVRNDIQNFFELDLDVIIGVTETRKMTDQLECKTGRRCIPVFHKIRGLQTWREMCREYPRVAIGASAVTEECRWVRNSDLLLRMVNIAHDYGALVHGLGYTRLSNLNDTKIPFDSVDSTSWMSGGRFATVYKFTGSKLISRNIKGRSPGYKVLDAHNAAEWIKMQKFKE